MTDFPWENLSETLRETAARWEERAIQPRSVQESLAYTYRWYIDHGGGIHEYHPITTTEPDVRYDTLTVLEAARRTDSYGVATAPSEPHIITFTQPLMASTVPQPEPTNQRVRRTAGTVLSDISTSYTDFSLTKAANTETVKDVSLNLLNLVQRDYATGRPVHRYLNNDIILLFKISGTRDTGLVRAVREKLNAYDYDLSVGDDRYIPETWHGAVTSCIRTLNYPLANGRLWITSVPEESMRFDIVNLAKSLWRVLHLDSNRFSLEVPESRYKILVPHNGLNLPNLPWSSIRPILEVTMPFLHIVHHPNDRK